MFNKLSIGIVGGGYVGSATALFKCNTISCTIYDLNVHKRQPSTCTLKDVSACDLVFICVPTPSNTDGSCNINIVKSVVKQIFAINNKADIIVRSTVPPGTCQQLEVAFMPEFLTEKHATEDFKSRTSWILGLDHNQKHTYEKVQFLLNQSQLAGNITGKTIHKVGTTEAEFAKYARNCFLASKVAFFNEMYTYCHKNQIEYNTVRHLICMDSRIGKSHTQVPGPDGNFGFGGSCFPKDLAALISSYQQSQVPAPVLSAVQARNGQDRQARPNNHKYKISICAIVKDEIDLEEWVAYHLLLGFEHFYIYDNLSQVSVKERLAGVSEYVTVIKHTDKSSHKQFNAYNHCCKNYKDQTNYLMFIDGDEFVVLHKHHSIQAFLDDYQNCDGLGINWVQFDSNQHVARPEGLVIENYTQCDNLDKHIKSIVKAETVVKCQVHHMRLKRGSKKYIGMNGRPIRGPRHEVNTDVIQINHYFTRSLEDWGHRLIRKQPGTLVRDMKDFYKNFSSKDTTIIDQGWPQRIRQFMSEHKLSNAKILQSRVKLPKNFKWYNYLCANSNLISKCGSEKAALMHWLTYGAKEKRLYYDAQNNLDKFDWQEYQNQHAELKDQSKVQIYLHRLKN